ncbi:MAG: hypothetical protein Q9162_001507 [Coniocarpon cinnabarinum]
MSTTAEVQTSGSEPDHPSPSLKKMPKKDDLHYVYAAANGPADIHKHAPVVVPKYKHVMAIHTEHVTSCLTHGTSDVSFAGFRNLMVLVIEPLPELYKSCPYPRNITVNNLLYFWWAPTLVYQPVYPRTSRIRWLFIFYRSLEVLGLSVAIWIASAQYAVPLLHNSLPVISDLDLPQILERLMKLSSISLFCWLAGFYAVFHSALNLLAELLRFGDRSFYGDFWNSSSLKMYWKLWNRPVYCYMKRHVFMPLVGRGCPPLVAQVVVFVLSAILHEMLVGVPTHNILGVAFSGMMLQLPLIALTELLAKLKGLRGETIGNCIFWISFVLFSRLIGGVGSSTTRKSPANDPQQRLTRFKKAYEQTLSVWRKLSPSKPDPLAVDTVRGCLQRLTTLLHDDTRAPAPHLCLSFAASSQFYLTVSRIALSLNNEDIIRDAVAWFNALVDNDEENLLSDDRFAEALMNFVESLSGTAEIVEGSQIEGEVLELMFGIAAKIRLDPDLLSVWFMSEDQSSSQTPTAGRPSLSLGDRKRFPLCYQFVGRVYHEGRAGDFARTGLLYVFECVSHSPELERWIIESDLPTLMASGLGALYSQLSRKLNIDHPRQNLPLILALSGEQQGEIPDDVDSFYAEETQSQLSTFMSNLVFWQDILEHCRSLEIKQTLIDHFQVFFLQQILYPSLLQSSDADGGSSVAVLTYLWRILDSLEHPDLINLILQYLLAVTNGISSEPITPRSPAVENRRQSLLSLAQIDGAEQTLTPSLFNLADLILAGVTSENSGTLTAALRLTTTLIVKHHPRAYSTLFKISANRSPAADRIYGSLDEELGQYFTLAHQIGGMLGVDEAYKNCVKDGLGLIESHACSAARLDMTKGGVALEARHRSAILEDQSRTVQPHHLHSDDPLITALMSLLETFFTNSIETNLGLTNVLAHLAACPYVALEGWLVTDPKNYRLPLAGTALHNDDSEEVQLELPTPDEMQQDQSEVDPDKAEEARVGAFHAACRRPACPDSAHPRVLQALEKLSKQLEDVRPTIPNLDFLLASRKRAFSGLDEMERPVRAPASATRTPLDSLKPSRNPSRKRPARPEPGISSISGTDGNVRGRSLATVANLQRPDETSPTPSARSQQSNSSARTQSPLKINNRNLSTSPGPKRTLSPLKAVMTPDDLGPQPLSARSRSTMRAAEAQILDRKLHFPLESDEPRASGLGPNSESHGARDNGARDDRTFSEQSSKDDDGNGAGHREASLSHVLTNIVILQEFVLEIMALIHVRCSLLDNEVNFQ